MTMTFVYFLTLTIGTVHGWMNAMDKELNFKCPAGSTIYEINSKHDNFFEDRVFEILCRPTGKSSTGCQWTGEFIDSMLSKVMIYLIYNEKFLLKKVILLFLE